MIIPFDEVEGLTPPKFDEVETPQPENLVPASIAPMITSATPPTMNQTVSSVK
jgi:hypothetical protein